MGCKRRRKALFMLLRQNNFGEDLFSFESIMVLTKFVKWNTIEGISITKTDLNIFCRNLAKCC